MGLDNVKVETPQQRTVVKLDEEKILEAWENLGSADAVEAHKAIWDLISADEQTVTFMQKHSGDALAGADLGELIKQHDSKDFRSRETATKRLIELAPFTKQEVTRLKAAMDKTESAEVQDRLGQILNSNTSAPANVRPEERRRRRVNYVLELIGTDSARELRRKRLQSKPKYTGND